MDQAETFEWLRQRSNRLDEVEAELVACQLECARLRVKPIVDNEKKGEEIGDLMNMQLSGGVFDAELKAREIVKGCSNWHDIQHKIVPRLVEALKVRGLN